MSDVAPIRVVIVDDHLMVRDGLQVFLSQYGDIVVVGEAGNGREALRVCRETKPDVVLMDMVMPEMDGPQATTLIKEARPATQIIALTSFTEGDLVQQAIQAGAIGYLHKDVHANRLAEAIRDASVGLSTIDVTAAQVLIRASRQPDPIGHDLTPRQYEVLARLVDGKTNKTIAGELSISSATVRLHVSNILSKLGANNRTEAVRLALQYNLLDE